MMSEFELAVHILRTENVNHVIYGYRAKGKSVRFTDPSQMLRFGNDDSYAQYIDHMQSEIDGLDMIFAVHAG